MEIVGTKDRGSASESQGLSYFFGNLARMTRAAGLTGEQLSRLIGENGDYIDTMIASQRSPDLEVVYAIAEALNVDIADLLRPGPSFGLVAESRANYSMEKLAEEVLASALEKSREQTSFDSPSFDAVLSWWYANQGLLTEMRTFEQYVEIFCPPDPVEMRPRPKRIGKQSLAARELGITEPGQMLEILDASDPKVAVSVATAHNEVLNGQPQLSFHSIMINLSTGNLVKLSYVRLLMPCRDGDGQRYVLNYSKPIRRNEIGREHVGEFEPIHRGKPVLSGMN